MQHQLIVLHTILVMIDSSVWNNKLGHILLHHMAL